MLQWNDGTWEHRAYWGANLITWGTDGTVSRHYMGPLPATGQWVQLAVPASQVGLEGSTLNGMAYTLYNGRATWDYAGKTAGVAPVTYQVSGTVTLNGVGAKRREPRGHRWGELLIDEHLGQLRLHRAARMVGHRHAFAERLHLHPDLTDLQQRRRQPDGAELRRGDTADLSGERDGHAQWLGVERRQPRGHRRGELLIDEHLRQLRLHGAAGLDRYRHAVVERLHLHPDLAPLQQCDRQPDGAELCGRGRHGHRVGGRCGAGRGVDSG